MTLIDKIRARLVDDWKTVVRVAWSFRLNLLFAAIGAVGSAFTPHGEFVLSMAIGHLVAAAARILAQKKMTDAD